MTTTVYEAVGGEEFFTALAHAFYVEVAQDPVLMTMYPADDMVGAENRLRLFLEQYWGGPTTYSEQRGHPRLRMRHFRFTIGQDAQEHWLKCMRAALNQQRLPGQLDSILWTYFEKVADAMVNTSDETKD